MTATQPLTGIMLIDCAQANEAQGTDTPLCGYSSDTESFQTALRQADMDITLYEMSDLLSPQDV